MKLFNKHFRFQTPSKMLEILYNSNNKNKNDMVLSIIKSGLCDLKNVIKKMPEYKIINEKPHKIIDIVEKILQFNQQKQQGSGLKVLTASQMLNRLPITLAQIKQEIIQKNLKMKLGNYFIPCTDQEKLTATIYKSLIDII